MSATYQEHGDIGVITLNNPPVNGLGHATRAGIVDGVGRALENPAIKAIVITGAGKGFSGGADIREFNSPKAMQEPSLHTVIRVIEEADKPVIAAIHGIAMGGGLELALGCHYRVATAGAQIALPEVKLGILPGAGGTQRLPRVLGVEMALNMIVTGNTVLSEKLSSTKLFDQMIAGDLIEGALAFAKKIADTRPLPKVRDIRLNYPNADGYLQFARNTVRAVAGKFPAPLKCVDAVAAAVSKKFDDGIRYERDLFLELVQTTESKALRHAFFGERAASKVPDVPSDTPLRDIQSAGVIGAGTMGAGIAMNFANAGIPVKMLEMKQEALDKGLATIRKNYENTMKKGKLTQEQLDKRMGLITGTMAYADLAQSDIVVEAVFEDMAVKEKVFTQLDAVMKPGAILASNTSTLDVDQIAAFTKRPQDVIGTHFFSPANVMKLLEIVRGEKQPRMCLPQRWRWRKKFVKPVWSRVCVMVSSATAWSSNIFARRASCWKRVACLSRSIKRLKNSVSRWALSACLIWPVMISAGISASAVT
jgi:3-hydroxyacyl-CoA dehydrogenase